MSLPATIPAGIRRVEFQVSLNAASDSITAQKVDAQVRTWNQGIPSMSAPGSVILQGAPNTVVHNANGRKVVRTAVHLRLSQPMTGNVLANYIATSLIVAGASANHGVLVNALRQGQGISFNVPHAAVGEAWARVSSPPASAAPRVPVTGPGVTVAPSGVPGGAAGTGVDAVVPAGAVVAPVPLGIVDRVAAGPVLSATNTAMVGDPQRVLSPNTLTDPVRAGDVVRTVVVVAAVIGAVYGAVLLYRKVAR